MNARRQPTLIEITPEVVLKAYACGFFDGGKCRGSGAVLD
jgi:hypothetical protein